jgi:hypothetical protein
MGLRETIRQPSGRVLRWSEDWAVMVASSWARRTVRA